MTVGVGDHPQTSISYFKVQYRLIEAVEFLMIDEDFEVNNKRKFNRFTEKFISITCGTTKCQHPGETQISN